MAVLLVQLGDQLPQLKLFPLNKNILAVEVLGFLLGKDEVQSIIQISYLVVDLLLVVEDLQPVYL